MRSAEPWSAPADFPPPASKRATKAANDEAAKRWPERRAKPTARLLPARWGQATSAPELLRDCSQVPRINIPAAPFFETTFRDNFLSAHNAPRRQGMIIHFTPPFEKHKKYPKAGSGRNVSATTRKPLSAWV